MILGRTYIVGGNSLITKTISYSGDDVTINEQQILDSTSTIYLRDVMSDPNNYMKAIAVGNIGPTTHGVWVTIDGGVTWNESSGSYQEVYDVGDMIEYKYNEVWYVDSDIIYACGDNGKVIKSTDGGVTFNPVSVVDNYGHLSNNIDSIHFYDSNIGVVGLEKNIAVTNNGGLSWDLLFQYNNGIEDSNQLIALIETPPFVGDNTPGIRIRKDSNNNLIIDALFTNLFAHIDVDGNILDLPSNTGLCLDKSYKDALHLTWLDDNLFIIGTGGKVSYSPNNGNTWFIRQSHSNDTESRYAAHYYYNEDNDIVGYYSGTQWNQGINNVYKDIDLGLLVETAFTDMHIEDSNNDIIYSIWTGVENNILYELTPCDDQDSNLPTLVVDNDFSGYVGGVIGLTIPFRSMLPEQDVALAGRYLSKVITLDGVDSFYIPSVSKTAPTGYVRLSMIPWATFSYETELITEDSPYFNLPDAEIEIIDGSDETDTVNIYGCYSVDIIDYSSSLEIITLPNDINDIEYFGTDCITCTGTCYLLTNCDDDTDTIIASNDLSEYIDYAYLSFDDCVDKRYTIELSDTCIGSINISFNVVNEHTSCIDIIEEEVSFRTRAVKPGYYTDGCDPAYTEKVNCKFGEQQYIDMAEKRYGIKVCCHTDDMRYIIKKKLLDLKSISFPEINCVSYNSNDCCSSDNSCSSCNQ